MNIIGWMVLNDTKVLESQTELTVSETSLVIFETKTDITLVYVLAFQLQSAENISASVWCLKQKINLSFFAIFGVTIS